MEKMAADSLPMLVRMITILETGCTSAQVVDQATEK
jgi:hypothetical protein